MSEETNSPPADAGATEQQAAVVSGSITIPNSNVTMTADELAEGIGSGGIVIAAPVLETLTGGVGADVVEGLPFGLGEDGSLAWAEIKLTDAGILHAAHDAIAALLDCAGRLRVLDRLAPDTLSKANEALASLKVRLDDRRERVVESITQDTLEARNRLLVGLMLTCYDPALDGKYAEHNAVEKAERANIIASVQRVLDSSDAIRNAG